MVVRLCVHTIIITLLHCLLLVHAKKQRSAICIVYCLLMLFSMQSEFRFKIKMHTNYSSYFPRGILFFQFDLFLY